MTPKPRIRTSKPYQAHDSMKTPKRSILSTKARQTPNRVKFSMDSPDNSRLNRSSRLRNENVAAIPRPLLGYDWIAGVVEMDSLPSSSTRGIDLTQDFIDEIDDFRKTNREECSRKLEVSSEKHITPIKPRRKYVSSPDPSDTLDTRILDYTVNSRLFPVPVDNTIEVRPGTKTSPRFIRISVPKSVLTTPNKFKPRSTMSRTNADSMSLHDHCMRGREYALPSRDRVPRPKLTSHLDLKASLLPDPSKRVRDVGALHSTIVNLPPSLSGSYREPSSFFR